MFPAKAVSLEKLNLKYDFLSHVGAKIENHLTVLFDELRDDTIMALPTLLICN